MDMFVSSARLASMLIRDYNIRVEDIHEEGIEFVMALGGRPHSCHLGLTDEFLTLQTALGPLPARYAKILKRLSVTTGFTPSVFQCSGDVLFWAASGELDESLGRTMRHLFRTANCDLRRADSLLQLMFIHVPQKKLLERFDLLTAPYKHPN